MIDESNDLDETHELVLVRVIVKVSFYLRFTRASVNSYDCDSTHSSIM